MSNLYAWPCRPTQYPWEETLEWYTKIHVSSDGSEERVRLRNQPRRAFQYVTDQVNSRIKRQLESLVIGEQIGPYVVGDWTKKPSRCFLIGASSTDAAFSITDEDIARLGLELGDYIVVEKNGVYATGRTIVLSEYINDGTTNLQVTDATFAEFNKRFSGNKFVKLWKGHRGKISPTTASVAVTGFTDRIVTTMELLDYKGPAGEPFPQTFFGLNIFDYRPNQPTDWQQIETEFRVQRIDNQIGKWSIVDEAGRSFVTRAQEYVILDPEDVDQLREWLQFIGGANRSFYLPTWNSDLHPISIPSSTQINVENFSPITIEPDISYRNKILVRLKNGDHIPLEIVEVTNPTTSDVQTITVAVEDSFDFTIDEIRGISWLDPVRLQSDVVTINHFSSSIKTFQLTAQGVRE